MGELLKLRLNDGEVLVEPPPAREAGRDHPSAAGGEGGAPAALSPLPGDRMGYLDQAWNTARHAVRVTALRWRTAKEDDGSLAAAAYKGVPVSLEQHAEYGRGRAWVPTGHDGGAAELGGVVWNRTIGAAGVALGNWINFSSHKPLRGILTFLVFFALVVIGMVAFGHVAAALQMTGALAALAAVVWMLLAWFAGRRHQAVPPPDDGTDL